MGINIGAFFCNFIAAILRNKWEGIFGWQAAFSAAGIGLIIGMIVLAMSLKHIKTYDVKRPNAARRYAYLQNIGNCVSTHDHFAVIGWFMPGNILVVILQMLSSLLVCR